MMLFMRHLQPLLPSPPELMNPVLRAMKEMDSSAYEEQHEDQVCRILQLTDEQRTIRFINGKPALTHFLGIARHFLSLFGLMAVNPGGLWLLTRRGRETGFVHPAEVIRTVRGMNPEKCADIRSMLEEIDKAGDTTVKSSLIRLICTETGNRYYPLNFSNDLMKEFIAWAADIIDPEFRHELFCQITHCCQKDLDLRIDLDPLLVLFAENCCELTAGTIRLLPFSDSDGARQVALSHLEHPDSKIRKSARFALSWITGAGIQTTLADFP